MRRLLIFLIIGLTDALAIGERGEINDAEALVRQQVNDPKLKFAHVQFTGDSSSGQTCWLLWKGRHRVVESLTRVSSCSSTEAVVKTLYRRPFRALPHEQG